MRSEGKRRGGRREREREGRGEERKSLDCRVEGREGREES